MDAARLAAVCAKIDEYDADGAPMAMTGNRVAAFCAMIEDGAAARNHRRKSRRRRRCVDSTNCYRQIARIGSGSFGAVIKARHRKTGQTVAIKKFFPRWQQDRDDDGEKQEAPTEEVLREACFLAACGGHPNLVGLHTVARDPRTKEYSLVMEYVGPTLHHALRRHVRLHDGAAFPEAHVRRVVKQILTGAQAMHSLGIVHQDIKTENVLVEEEEDGCGGGGGGAKICDFGLAVTTAEAKSGWQTWAGTVAYMAPEVLMYRSGYDERVDMWSIGCVMAELLSGEVLFEDGDRGHQIDRIFDLVGTPPEKTFQTFMSPFMASKVLRRRAAEQEEPPRPACRRGSRLRERFPSHVLSKDGYKVLKGLLTCNPKKRLTAAKALQLPWFTRTDTVGVPASESEVDASATEEESTQTALPIQRMLTSVWSFFRKMALPLIKLPHQLF